MEAREDFAQALQAQINGLRMNLCLVGQPLLETSRHSLSRNGLFTGQQSQHGADTITQLAAVDDHIERAVLQ